MTSHGVFADRIEAGRELARRLMHLSSRRPVVLALPRGGVPVGFEVAKALQAPLDVLFVRKIGAPMNPEFGIGAVVDGAHPQLVLDEAVISQLDVPPGYVEAEMRRQLEEITRRRGFYRHGRDPVETAGRTVIVVDDGIATGGTVRASLRALARLHPAHVVLAVPVAPADTLDQLAGDADEIVCLTVPEPFYAVGQHYRQFDQTSDEDVVRLLDEAAGWSAPPAA